jgi:hypothetical protein
MSEASGTTAATKPLTSRYCRHCRELRPLSVFPAGPRRYICKAHLYEHVKLPAKLRVQADDKRRVLNQLWARCRTDSRALGQTAIQLGQSDIAEILQHKGIDLAFAIVPAHASRMLSRENFAVVANEARRALMWNHRLGGHSLYLSTLATLQCVESQEPQPIDDTERVDTEANKSTLQYVLN